MKIIAGGSRWEIEPPDGPTIFVEIYISSTNSEKFTRALALLDTGMDFFLSVPEELSDDLGFDHKTQANEKIVTQTSGGIIDQEVSRCNLRILNFPSAAPITFESIPVSINPRLEYPVLGMGVLRFFNVILHHGDLMHLEFNPKSVEIAQRQAEAPTEIVPKQIENIQQLKKRGSKTAPFADRKKQR